MRVRAVFISLMFGICLSGVVMFVPGVSTPVNAQQQGLPKPLFVEPEYFLRKHLQNLSKPDYPLKAQEAGIQGEVVVFVWFDKSGNLIEARPLISPDETLSKAVVKMLEEAKVRVYAPYDPDVNYMSELRFIFSLKGGKPDVHDASVAAQRQVSKEFTREMEHRAAKKGDQ